MYVMSHDLPPLRVRAGMARRSVAIQAGPTAWPERLTPAVTCSNADLTAVQACELEGDLGPEPDFPSVRAPRPIAGEMVGRGAVASVHDPGSRPYLGPASGSPAQTPHGGAPGAPERIKRPAPNQARARCGYNLAASRERLEWRPGWP